MLEIVAASGFMDTPKVLRDHLEDRGVSAICHYSHQLGGQKVRARICWGLPDYSQLPCLNAKATLMSKFRQTQVMLDAGVQCPPIWTAVPSNAALYPLLGRRSHHDNGKDIKVFQSPVDARNGSWDFLTKLIESDTEFRAWVWRGEVLAVYERVQRGESKNTRIFGRNWDQGWRFDYLDKLDWPKGCQTPSIEAVKAVNLDFGAVDFLRGRDKKLYVLEVNSAPCMDWKTGLALQRLADRMVDWYKELKDAK